MRAVYSPDQVREAERPLIARDGDEVVMRRAARGLEIACATMIAGDIGIVTGAQVLLLVGTGNNGGDALWAGVGLLSRGAAVHAITVGDAVHPVARAAFERHGGRCATQAEWPDLVANADLVIDGLVGIGGRGALRSAAAECANLVNLAGVRVVACDIPSGVDATSGAVEGVAVRADLTVTFGALKPGLLLMPGAEFVGVLHLVDIGLDPFFEGDPVAHMLLADDVADSLPVPTSHDHKYSRGVVAIDAGSPQYPGAALLSVGAARRGGAGLVSYVGAVPDLVVSHFPDVVVSAFSADRVSASLIGPGLAPGGEPPSLIHAEAPLVLDATALREVGGGGEWANAVRRRAARGLVTAMTPHDGELVALGSSPELLSVNRIDAARSVAEQWGAVVLLKGATTVVVAPSGDVFITPIAPAQLATAGSGDVLAGLAASWLASAEAQARANDQSIDVGGAARVLACAAWLHALAGRVAGAGAVVATDLIHALPVAINIVRGDSP